VGGADDSYRRQGLTSALIGIVGIVALLAGVIVLTTVLG